MAVTDWLIRWLADRLLSYFADVPIAPLSRDERVQRIMLRLASTPTLFGGDWTKVFVGRNVKLVNTLLNVTSGTITIGDDTFFGHGVSLLTGTHETGRTAAARQDFPSEGHDIMIGKGVWIASGATVLGPCTIEDDVVVAAGAVIVGGTLERGGVYAGIPARKVKSIRE